MRLSMIFFVVLLLDALNRTDAQAQVVGSQGNAQSFRPAMDSKGDITLNSAQSLPHLGASVGLITNWQYQPLWFTRDSLHGYRVNHYLTSNLQVALGLLERFEAGVGVPFSLYSGEAQLGLTQHQRISAQGIGDIGLHLKGRIWESVNQGSVLGVMTSAYFPTSQAPDAISLGQFVGAPSLLFNQELFHGDLRVGLNLGARFNQHRQTIGTYGLSINWSLVTKRINFIAELIGQVVLKQNDQLVSNISAPEIISGVRLYLSRDSYFTIGAGRGLVSTKANSNDGSPKARIFGAFVFEPTAAVKDHEQLTEAELSVPSSPLPPKKVIFDRDGDGIEDSVDKCPDAPEDKDGFEDDDGCPDLDNDQDGILDDADLCLNESESRNDFEDEDGCPDTLPIRRTESKIQLFDKIYFETNSATIAPVSFAILDALAFFLRTSPDITLIEIQGHADERGAANYNWRLTQARAESVMKYLREKEVEPQRLKARGYGETQPINRAHNEQAWSQNRRVEFIILKR